MVVILTNDREIPGSTPGRHNLQIKITSLCSVGYSTASGATVLTYAAGVVSTERPSKCITVALPWNPFRTGVGRGLDDPETSPDRVLA